MCLTGSNSAFISHLTIQVNAIPWACCRQASQGQDWERRVAGSIGSRSLPPAPQGSGEAGEQQDEAAVHEDALHEGEGRREEIDGRRVGRVARHHERIGDVFQVVKERSQARGQIGDPPPTDNDRLPQLLQICQVL